MNSSSNFASSTLIDAFSLRISGFGNSSCTDVTINALHDENIDSNMMNHDQEITHFDSKQVITGQLMGKGAFCKVYEIKNINTESRTKKCLFWYRRASQSFQTNRNENGEGNHHSYALKMVRKSVRKNRNQCDHAAAGLTIERDILSSLRHKNIVRMYGLIVDSNAIIIEKVDSTLDRWIIKWRNDSICREKQQQQQRKKNKKKQQLPLNDENNDNNIRLKVKLAYQIAKALSYLHEHNIIYRDLKPDNIGVHGNGEVKLFDFGLSRRMEMNSDNNSFETQYHMSLAGTQRYMAPEVFNSQYYNTKADIYSWSMIFYEMLSLEKPFKKYDSRRHAKFVCIDGECPSFTQSLRVKVLPRCIKDILSVAWDHDVSKRINSCSLCENCKLIEISLH